MVGIIPQQFPWGKFSYPKNWIFKLDGVVVYMGEKNPPCKETPKWSLFHTKWPQLPMILQVVQLGCKPGRRLESHDSVMYAYADEGDEIFLP